ncbi:1008_t:CDS:2, partial [Funneliformis geosporum]
DDMDHNKQSGNNPIEVRYKEEVENILDGNRPSLTPKSLDSSLEFDNANIEENNIPFNEITGRNKRKNESELTQEEKPQKANRSEVRQVKALHSSNNMALPQTNNVPFYFQSTSIDLMQNNVMQNNVPQINAMQIDNTTQIKSTTQIDNTNVNTLHIRSPSPPHFDEF